MNRILSSLLLLLALTVPRLLPAQVQQIIYTEPEREDSRRTNFEIIGKIDGNILVFKNNSANNAICIYDSEMKLLQRVPLTFMPEKYVNVDFVAYPDHCYIIYEYQKKSIVHCTAVKLNGQAQQVGQPME